MVFVGVPFLFISSSEDSSLYVVSEFFLGLSLFLAFCCSSCFLLSLFSFLLRPIFLKFLDSAVEPSLVFELPGFVFPGIREIDVCVPASAVETRYAVGGRRELCPQVILNALPFCLKTQLCESESVSDSVSVIRGNRPVPRMPGAQVLIFGLLITCLTNCRVLLSVKFCFR